MPSILITGENGFIGQGFKIYSQYTDIKSVSLRNKKPDSIDFSGIDVILHLAAIVHSSGRVASEEYLRVNRDMTVELAGAAKKAGVKHFIFMSTIKVYGEFKEGSDPWNEFSECSPEDSYGRSKFEAEQELKKLESENFCVSIIRTPVVYGPGMKANMQKIFRLVRICPVLPFGRIENTRNYTYIKNLAGFIDRIIDLKSSGVFIAMDNERSSTTELVSYIADSFKRRVILFHPPGAFIKILSLFFPALPERLYGSVELDNSFTKKILSFNPVFTTREGIRETTEESNRVVIPGN